MFEWDEGKNKSNEAKHGLSFEDAEQFFAEETLTFEDDRHDYGEPRFISFGVLGGEFVVVAHTPRRDKTRIISMRKGNRRDQKIFEERHKTRRRND